MSAWFQIGGISGIVLLMLIALTMIFDNPDCLEFKKQLAVWCCVAAVIIALAIW